MHTTLLLLTLAQFDGFSTWTDSEGVVHVVSSQQAPAGAKVMEGGSYSVIDGDGRPLIMPDGGTRSADAAWWRERFAQARLALQASEALERAATADVHAAEREVCATAEATAQVRVVIPRRRGAGGDSASAGWGGAGRRAARRELRAIVRERERLGLDAGGAAEPAPRAGAGRAGAAKTRAGCARRTRSVARVAVINSRGHPPGTR